MLPCFFDTCALVPRYRVGKFRDRVNRIFSGSREIFIAEISMVEIVSAFASHCRENQLADAEFYRMRAEFYADIASERIKIRPMGRDDMLRATHLIALGGVTNRRGLKSADAMVAVSCRELAFERGSRLSFYTKDWKLYRTLYEINAYRAALKLHYFGKGRDGIPARTR